MARTITCTRCGHVLDTFVRAGEATTCEACGAEAVLPVPAEETDRRPSPATLRRRSALARLHCRDAGPPAIQPLLVFEGLALLPASFMLVVNLSHVVDDRFRDLTRARPFLLAAFGLALLWWMLIERIDGRGPVWRGLALAGFACGSMAVRGRDARLAGPAR